MGYPCPNMFLINQALITSIEPEKGFVFAEDGDSGSVVLEGDKAVGLLWAGGPGGAGKQGIMSPIDEVTSRLGISMVW